MLPWGSRLRVRPSQSVVGRAVMTLGVFDLMVSEVLWRLIEPDDMAVDVGANVGHMTSLMAVRAGAVRAFEPHPGVYQDLVHNIGLNPVPGRPAPVATRAAVSDHRGDVVVVAPDGFERNDGIASVVADGNASGPTAPAVALDDVFADTAIGVLKIDVEGHELNVVRSGRRLFETKSVRDCVFESHDSYPTPVTRVLADYGYTVYGLAKGFRGPVVTRPDDPRVRSGWESTSLLATRDADRARGKLSPSGWRCLRGRG